MKNNFKHIWQITQTEYLYELRVQELMADGISRSDAQGIVDAEELQRKLEPIVETVAK
jgi:hypothetical protein